MASRPLHPTKIVSDSSDLPEPSDLALDEGMLLYVSVGGPTHWHKRKVLADDLSAPQGMRARATEMLAIIGG